MSSSALLLRIFFLDGTHVRIRVANADHLPVHAGLSALSSALGIERAAISECGIFIGGSRSGSPLRLLGPSVKLQPLPPGARFVLRRRRRVPSGPLESSPDDGAHHHHHRHVSPFPSPLFAIARRPT